MNKVFENPEKTAFLAEGIFTNIPLLEQCVLDIEGKLEERLPIFIYGRQCYQKRNIGFFSNESIGYNYSRQTVLSKQLSSCLFELITYINTLFSADFNGILVNEYMTGDDYISAHSDDEDGLDPVGVVAISYGEPRKFRIRDKQTKQIVFEIPTAHCGILHMGGDFQNYYTHEIPVEKRIREKRISFTFRKHLR
jgi:alkylated DNA repair dioxygenase AlkB